MTAMEEAKTAATKLSPEERRRLLEWLATQSVELGPGIYSTPGVCGGEACVGRSRIAVWLLESHRRGGLNDVDLLKAYPSLKAQDLASAWAYVAAHREEIDRLIQENESPDAE